MIKISDYIVQFIEEKGVQHVFMLAGGMAMHINDSLGNSSKLRPICMLHEQSCAYAAESYARITNNLGVVVATSGPGAINVLNGVAASWIESTPLLVITGQCKREDIAKDPNLRQLGIQEVNIVEMAKPITKYAVQISDPNKIKYELEKAVSIATTGRKGPVLIDIPLDIQATKIELKQLESYNNLNSAQIIDENQILQLVELLSKAKRPLIYAGAGIYMANAILNFRKLIDNLKIPVLVHWNAIGILEYEHPQYVGIPGAVGQRAANFAIQTCDLLITIGTRLSLMQTGYNYAEYAKNAKIVMVDIDEAELNKTTIFPYLKINADAGEFINSILDRYDITIRDYSSWLNLIHKWRLSFPTIKDEWRKNKDYVNSFVLAETISKCMSENDIYVGGRAGTCVDAIIQGFQPRYNIAYVTKGLSAMGNGLPAAIGGAYATGKKIVCMNGDGGFVMNIQELEVIYRDNLPIKIFILDNNGYSTIRATQKGVFDGHFVGCSIESGLTIGNIKKISEAYGIKTHTINSSVNLENEVKRVLEGNEPMVCVVKTAPDQPIEPRQANYKKADGQLASRPLEDMRPLLEPEVIKEIMDSIN